MVLSSKRLSEGRVQQKYISHLTFVIFYFFDCFPFKQCDILKTYQKRVSCLKGIQPKEKHLLDVIFHFSNFHKAIYRSVDCEDFSGKHEDFIIFAEGEKHKSRIFRL